MLRQCQKDSSRLEIKYISEAEHIFEDTLMNIMDLGHCYLGSAFGQNSYVEQFVKKKLGMWKQELW